MKKLLVWFCIPVFIFAVPARAAVEGALCSCDEGSIPGTWSVINRLTENSETTLGQCGPIQTGSNPCNGQTVTPQTCTLSGKTGKVTDWKISGNLGGDYWGVTGSTSGERTVTSSCTATCTINGWCQFCHLLWVAKYKTETVKMKCATSNSNASCPTLTGSKTTFQNDACTEIPSPDMSNCKANCPG